MTSLQKKMKLLAVYLFKKKDNLLYNSMYYSYVAIITHNFLGKLLPTYRKNLKHKGKTINLTSLLPSCNNCM